MAKFTRSSPRIEVFLFSTLARMAYGLYFREPRNGSSLMKSCGLRVLGCAGVLKWLVRGVVGSLWD